MQCAPRGRERGRCVDVRVEDRRDPGRGRAPDWSSRAAGARSGDIVEHDLLDVEQGAIDIVRAPLDRTVAGAAVKIGLDQTTRGRGIDGGDAYGMTS
jgi:hypothetical protein